MKVKRNWISNKAVYAMLYMVMKRFFDLILSTIFIVALSPILLIITTCVKITSKGNVFYQWKVVGKKGVPFMGYKFRTMVENADQLKKNLSSSNEMSGPVFKISNDPRITRLGKFLRKYSLDELPQLFSVLKGDMSIVGPRPPLQSEYEKFEEWQKKKVSVKPGITCLWQVNGRNDISSFDDWVKLDIEYIDNQSFLLDMKILLKTIPAVLRGTGK